MYNINADTAAAAIAGSLEAESLITMTDIRGHAARQKTTKARSSRVKVADAPKLVRGGVNFRRMIPEGAVLY